MTDTAKELQPDPKSARLTGDIYYFNASNPFECRYGHKAPRLTSNSQCLVCRHIESTIKRKLKLNLATLYSEHKDKVAAIERDAFQACIDTLRNAGFLIPVRFAEDVAEATLEPKDVGRLKGDDEPPETDAEATAEAIDDKTLDDAVEGLKTTGFDTSNIKDALTAEENDAAPTPDDAVAEPELIEPPPPPFGLAQAAETFVALIRPRIWATANVHNHLHRVGHVKATYSGAHQAVMRFKKREWLIDRGKSGNAIQYTTADKFYIDQKFAWLDYVEILPSMAKRIISNFLSVLQPVLDQTEDEIEFDDLDEVISAMKRKLDEITGKPKDDATAEPPPPNLKEADAQPVDVTADEFEDGLIADTLDAALVGRAIVSYILELQTDAGSAEYMRQLEDKHLETLNLKNQIAALQGKLKRQGEILSNYETQLKNEKHLNYQLKLRIERLKSGVGEPGQKKKGTFKVGELARINRAVKNPPTVIRRRYNEKGDATSTELNPRNDA